MSKDREQDITDRRTIILQNVARILRVRSEEAQKKAVETMKSKAGVDGPWQSKQPDEMIKIELQARILQDQAENFKEKAEEISSLLLTAHTHNGRVGTGSVFVWKMSDPDRPVPQQETVIITPSGGGEIEEFRLLSEKALITQAIIGKSTGDTINFGEITVTIKELL